MSPSSRQAIAGTPTGSRPHGGVLQGATHVVTQPVVPAGPSKSTRKLSSCETLSLTISTCLYGVMGTTEPRWK